jgi:hypothetical protein
MRQLGRFNNANTVDTVSRVLVTERKSLRLRRLPPSAYVNGLSALDGKHTCTCTPLHGITCIRVHDMHNDDVQCKDAQCRHNGGEEGVDDVEYHVQYKMIIV